MPKPEPKEEHKSDSPLSQHHPKSENILPPHIMHELLELREKVGKLEGMLEVLLKQK